jgi:hypothetical protein
MDEETPCADCRGSGVFPTEDGGWVSCICPAGFERRCASLDTVFPTTAADPRERVTPLESDVLEIASHYDEIERRSHASPAFNDRVTDAANHLLRRCIEEPGPVTSVSSYPQHEAVGSNDSRAKVKRHVGR